jgi:hypothetical protein
MPEKHPLRIEDDITQEEKDMLQDKYCGSFLPQGWRFDGRVYFNEDEVYSGVHPAMHVLVEKFVEEEN